MNLKGPLTLGRCALVCTMACDKAQRLSLAQVLKQAELIEALACQLPSSHMTCIQVNRKRSAEAPVQALVPVLERLHCDKQRLTFSPAV